MSVYYSKFDLNAYAKTPYFRAHVPEDYRINLVLRKARAFRRLPPRLRKLAALSKRWATRAWGDTGGGYPDIEDWYDDEGYELKAGAGERLTDEEIDSQWREDASLDDSELEDIPEPPGGFAGPDEWEPGSAKEEDVMVDREGTTEEDILRSAASHGRERTAREYGVPAGRAASIQTDQDLTRAILDMHGKPWPRTVARE